MKKWLVSIIMWSYNGLRFIDETIKSVLSQTYTNFEFIIINDCSNDNVEEIILKYKLKDKRIIYIKNSKNIWLTKSLNKWIKKSKWEYIARIDDNDLWDNNKLKKQVNFLENNPDYWIVWTNYIYIDELWTIIWKRSKTEEDLEIKKKILRQNPFVHMSVMFRKELTINYWLYNEDCLVWQDYDLWLRFWLITKMYNMQEFLTFTRLTKNWISAKNVKKQHKLWLQKCFKYRKKYPEFYKSILVRLLFFLMPKFIFDILVFIKEKIEKKYS